VLAEPLLVAIAALLATVLLTGVAYRYALRSRLLDVPNARSSHAAPTPRGGGVAIVWRCSCSRQWAA